MTSQEIQKRFDEMQDRDDWKGLQQLMERALVDKPEDHWLLTHLSSALYEQRHYRKALEVLGKSEAIRDDCPLTLWHKAGTLLALGRTEEARVIYKWIVRQTVSADEDPCWETEERARNLKADSLYCLGLCNQKLGKLAAAEQFYRRYYDLLLNGVEGMYTVEEVTDAIRSLHVKDSAKTRDRKVSAILHSAMNGKNGSRPKRAAIA